MSTTPLSSEAALHQLQWRYATKKFDPSKKIPESIWNTLEQSLVLSPSSFGLQPWKFFVIRNPELRQELLEHSWGQRPVVEASHLVVFTIKKNVDTQDVDRHVQRMAEVQQVPRENLAGFEKVAKGFLSQPPYPLDIDQWAGKQAYIALGFFMTCAAMLGIDTLPMEGFIPAKYDAALHLTNYSSVVICAAGYRALDDKHAAQPKVRFPSSQIVEYVD